MTSRITAGGGVAVYESEGSTMVVLRRRPREVVSRSTAASSDPTTHADFHMRIEGANIMVESGRIFVPWLAYENGEDGPGTWFARVQPQPVSGLVAGPTEGFIYLEIPIDQPPADPYAGGGGIQSISDTASIPPGVDYSFSIGVTNTLVDKTEAGEFAGDSLFVFYAEIMEASNSFFRRLMAEVTLDGTGIPLAIRPVQFASVEVPEARTFRWNASASES